ncbi:MAG: glycosyltransferase [Candidatus Omnitrophica bacterium]|nr:glycosyltransferase [Candidatus Omnitrophota bacterium]
MKILLLWRYYQEYLSYLYAKHPEMEKLGFDEHRQGIFSDHFGWPVEMMHHMNKKGICAELIVVNEKKLQKKWASENGFNEFTETRWEKQIVFEQIKRFKPDIIWIGALFDYCGEFVKSISSYCQKAIIWVGSPFIEKIDATGISVLLTENPNTLAAMHNQFEHVIVTKPGFSEDILHTIGAVKKKYDLSFIGGISPQHTRRVSLLASLIKNNIDIKIFADIRKNSRSKNDTCYTNDVAIIETVNEGPVFGLDMYRAMSASRVALNVHIDVAVNNAGNMRMFESTGTGACLLTEYARNINELFIPDEEILTYKNQDTLIDVIKKKIKNPDEVDAIAHAGQKRTLSQYTMSRMFSDIEPAFSL